LLNRYPDNSHQFYQLTIIITIPEETENYFTRELKGYKKHKKSKWSKRLAQLWKDRATHMKEMMEIVDGGESITL